jgi:phosphoglycolate phosphatase-like HAD superfamily hydrolase
MSTGPGCPRNWTWRVDAKAPGPAVIFDIDGVLADASGRQHHLAGLRRDWDAFFAECGEDPIIPEVARLLELLTPGLVVVLLTARPARVRVQTLAWLTSHGLGYDLLIMRAVGDRRPARDFKRIETLQLRTYGFEVRLAVEDDPANLEMFESEGVPCLYVHSGYYG